MKKNIYKGDIAAEYSMTDLEKIKEQVNIDIKNLHTTEKEGTITEFGRGRLEALEGVVHFINYLQEKKKKSK